jgi:hypothetical protein
MNVLDGLQALPTWLIVVLVVGCVLYVASLMWRLVGRLSHAAIGKGLLDLWFGQSGEK